MDTAKGIFCTQCGTANRADARFCWSCGSALLTQPTADPSVDDSSEPARPAPHAAAPPEQPEQHPSRPQRRIGTPLALRMPLHASTPQTLPLATSGVACPHCGALLAQRETGALDTCPFCNVATLAPYAIPPDLPQPKMVIPFAIDAEDAQGRFDHWLGAGFWRPASLRQHGLDATLRAVLVPLWSYEAHARSHWSASVGEPRTVRHRDGSSATSTTYLPVSGQHEQDHAVGGEALAGLPLQLLAKAGTYATGAAQPYGPALATGHDVALVNNDYAAALAQGQRNIERVEYDACSKMVPGMLYIDLKVNTQVSGLTAQLFLVPLYIFTYTHQGRVYQGVVNGQDGVVAGDAPVDKTLVYGVAIFVVAVILLCILIQIAKSGH